LVIGCDHGFAVRRVPQLRARKRWLLQEHRIDGIAITELLERRSTGRKPKRRPAMFANGALRYTRLEKIKAIWVDSDAICSNFWRSGATQKARSAMPCSGETRYGKMQDC
jgi:hypothetical protein